MGRWYCTVRKQEIDFKELIMEKTITIETEYGTIPIAISLNGDLTENEDGTLTYKIDVDCDSINLLEIARKYMSLAK